MYNWGSLLDERKSDTLPKRWLLLWCICNWELDNWVVTKIGFLLKLIFFFFFYNCLINLENPLMGALVSNQDQWWSGTVERQFVSQQHSRPLHTRADQSKNITVSSAHFNRAKKHDWRRKSYGFVKKTLAAVQYKAAFTRLVTISAVI